MIAPLTTGECWSEKSYDKIWLLLSLMIPEAGSDFDGTIIYLIFLILLQ